MRSEARLLRCLRGAAPIAVGGATPRGTRDAVALLVGAGAEALVSFGLAAGLDPALRAGALLVPSRIVAGGRDYLPDLALCARLGGVTPGGLLHSDAVVATAAGKQALHAASHCVALDMESGIVAQAAQAAGLGFAALRAVCDPATRDLPPAARSALRADGTLALGAILASLLQRPQQVRALLALATDASAGRKALLHRIPVVRL